MKRQKEQKRRDKADEKRTARRSKIAGSGGEGEELTLLNEDGTPVLTPEPDTTPSV